jgi:hypothetical protein
MSANDPPIITQPQYKKGALPNERYFDQCTCSRFLEGQGLRKYFFIHQETKATYTNSLRPPKLRTLKLSRVVCSQTLNHGTVANVRPRRFIDNSKFKVSDNTFKVND